LGTYQNEAIIWNGGVENGGKGSSYSETLGDMYYKANLKTTIRGSSSLELF